MEGAFFDASASDRGLQERKIERGIMADENRALASGFIQRFVDFD